MATAPYAPSQMSLANFDATQNATATWLFSSSDTTVGQQSFEVQIINNDTGVTVLDTQIISSSQAQYQIPANTLVNRTVYKWRVQYTDTNGTVSPWSSYQVFTCSSIPVTQIVAPSSGTTIQGNTLSITANYSQAQNVSQQSFRIVVYANDQTTVVEDTGTLLSTANQQAFYGLTSGDYYVQSTVTSSDGLTGQSGLVAFSVNYTGGAQTPSITATPLPDAAAIRLDWTNDRQIPGNYVPSSGSPTYVTGIWGQAVNVAKYGEKVYWVFQQQNQFTYTSWFMPNVASTAFTTSQVIAHLRLDADNFMQMRYDPSDSTFVFEKTANSSGIVAKSATGLTFAAGDKIMIVMQQSTTSTVAYVGIGGAWYTVTFGTNKDPSGTYGVAIYGVNSYTANDPGLVSIQYAYVGCTPTDGEEANSAFDETHLTTDILTSTALQNIYNTTAQQTFGVDTVFLAEFDGNLVGGQTSTALSSWQITRIANGVSTVIDTIPYDSSVQTATYMDLTPLSGVQYTYEIASVDTSGNIGHDPVINASVTFDGWWITDLVTGSTFQFFYMVPDVVTTQNYGRSEYKTFGRFPIPAYSNLKYRSGKVGGWVIGSDTNTAYQQYETLKAIIDQHHQLVLRGDEGQGMKVDCYTPITTVPKRNHKEYQTIEVSFTEVASL